MQGRPAPMARAIDMTRQQSRGQFSLMPVLSSSRIWTRVMILVALGVAAMHLCSHYVVRHPQSGHPFVETAKDATLSEYTRDVPVSPTAWEETAEQMDMEILSPAYKVRVLRSILNHSNHTWQDMEGELQGYIIHTLLFMNIVFGERPMKTYDFVNAECIFHDPFARNANETLIRMPTRIHTWGLHPGDRYTGHSFPFQVECQVPPELLHIVHEIRHIKMDIRFDGGGVHVDTFPNEAENTTVVAIKKNLPVTITPPMNERSEFAVCVSPINFEMDEVTIWKLLEWRQHMLNIGVERVNWYTRANDEFRPLVEGFKALKGTKDVYRPVPILKLIPGDDLTDPYHHYSDQDVWYMECMLNNVYSSDYVMIQDVDEFPMPDFRAEKPLEQFASFMRNVEPHVGEVVMDRIEMVHSWEKGEPRANELQQSTFECASNGRLLRDVDKHGHESKTFYRSHTVAAFNQHRRRKMYPMPLELSERFHKRKNEIWWWHAQSSYEPDVWPKLLHYRKYGIRRADTCELPSPMQDMPAYDRYRDELWHNVSIMAKEFAHLVVDESEYE